LVPTKARQGVRPDLRGRQPGRPQRRLRLAREGHCTQLREPLQGSGERRLGLGGPARSYETVTRAQERTCPLERVARGIRVREGVAQDLIHLMLGTE
jgi:hypothetical protein